jgi:hypothetical protein
VRAAALPNIPAGTGPGQSSDLLTHLTGVAAQTGASGATQLAAAAQSLQLQANTLQQVAAQLQQQKTQQSGAGNSGQSFTINFADYANWSYVPVNTTYGNIPGAGSHGSGHFIIDSNGRAAWQAVNDGDVSAVSIYNGDIHGGTFQAYTDTVYQEVQASLGGLPNGGNAKNFAVVRANSISNPSDYVYGDVYLTTGLALMYELGCYIGGVKYVWQSGPVNVINLNFTMIAGVGSTPARYQGYSGTSQVFDFTNDGSHGEAIFPADLSHRYWGFRSDTYNNGQNTPAPANYVGCADNAPPAVPGSGIRLYRTSTVAPAQSVAAGVSPIGGDGTNPFFDANSEGSIDMTPLSNVLIGSFDSRNAYSGNNGVQVVNAGRYNVAARFKVYASNTVQGAVAICPVVFRYNSAGALQETIFMPQPSFFVNGFGGQYNTGFIGGSKVIGCQAGDILQLGIFNDPGTSGSGPGSGYLSVFSFTGEATGQHTYFEVALANWSFN